MVTSFYPPYSFGGDAIYVHHLSNELARRGHSVDVVHCTDAYRALGGKAAGGAWANHPRVRVHTLESRAGFLWPLAMHQTGGPAWGATRLRQILEQDFDVIHFHNVSLIGGPDVLAYGRAIKLYTMHEFWLVCPTHLLYRYDGQPCEETRCLRCTLAHGRPPQLWRYTSRMRDALRHIDRLFALSRFAADAHRRRGIEGIFHILPPFVPPASETVPAQPSDPYFLFAGRLETIKGLHSVIPHFKGTTGPQLLVAGTGTQEAELRKLAASSPRVRFLGFQSQQQLSPLFRNAIAAIIPSVSYDMFTLVVLEAFRQGTPVVMRHIGGLPEIADASGGCLTFSTGPELDSALDLLAADSDTRNQLGQNALAAYRRLWTPEAHLANYLSAIGEVAASRQRTP